MYQISKSNNTISKIQETTFSSLNYTERAHLQEWIADTPNIFWEDLLIIQKEFDGFSDTRERLDLLALDKDWNLVIIENKLDDTGRDVVRQSLKYASYCSTLRKSEIIDMYQSYLDRYNSWKNATKEIENFYDTDDLEDIEFNRIQSQRIIMVAWSFRKEVTSTALRLMNYWLRVQCFKATVYVQWDQHFMSIDQIIPIPDAEDFTIKMSSKQQEEAQVKTKQTRRHIVRKEFWNKLFPVANEMSDLFSNVSPTTDHWISAWSGISWVVYSYVVTRSYCRVELYPWHKSAEENIDIFNKLLDHKKEIETAFWDELIRDSLEWKKATRISYRLEWVSIFNEEDHERMVEFMANSMTKLHKAMDPVIQKIR